MTTITDLPSIIAGLPESSSARFQRILDVQLVPGECVIPETMRDWTIQRFGSVEEVEHQLVVRVTNKITWEGAIFNALRTRRPLLLRPSASNEPADPHLKDDVFFDPLRTTAMDVYGRIRGEHCITTSNVARWDGQCSVLIFDEPDPFAFTRGQLRDYFRTALRWAERAHQADPQARHLVWMWNGGTAGGASIPHAHAQMGLGRQTPYAMVEGLRRAAQAYRNQYGSDYFEDLYAIHDDVGLGLTLHGLRGFVHLVAMRARDTVILGNAFDDALADAVHDVLRALIDRAGLRGFDIGVIMPPLFDSPDFNDEDWSGFPVIARILDRGRPDAMSSDVGAMDFFAQRIIADDPFLTYERVRDCSAPGMAGPAQPT